MTEVQVYVANDGVDGDDIASLASALAVAEYFRLTTAQARGMLRQVTSAVSRWRSVAGFHGLTPTKIAAMEPAFAQLESHDRNSV